jgi:hypothetical protein
MKALLPLLFVAMPAFAEPLPDNCAQDGLAVMVAKLRHDYGEVLAASRDDRKTGAVVSLYGSDKTGTWKVLSTLPNGVTCLDAAGIGFEPLMMEAPA